MSREGSIMAQVPFWDTTVLQFLEITDYCNTKCNNMYL